MPENQFDPFQQVTKMLQGAQQQATTSFQPYADRMNSIVAAKQRALQEKLAAQMAANTSVVNTGGATAIGNKANTKLSQNYMSPAKNYGRPELEKMARLVARELGWNDAEYNAWADLINRESGWNPNAKNPKSTAYGLGQFLDSTWAGTGYKRTNDPMTQLRAMAKYIQSRYKTPSGALKFWMSKTPIKGKNVGHWY